MFTDEQVTNACSLHIDNLRRLITWGAVKPVQGGGGRGRVRKWTARQALRISVTAQFVEAGFSLQMGHTLTYCLPLDDLLYFYDPDIIRTLMKGKRDSGALRLKALMSRSGKHYWPTKRYLGSNVLIVDRQFMYADVLDPYPALLAVIEPERQRVWPTFNPYRFVYGAGMVEEFGLPKVVDAETISRSSLLIDDNSFVENESWNFALFEQKVPKGLISQIPSLDSLLCRNVMAINLAVGLTACVRKLLKLPVNYRPMEEENDED